MIRELKFVSSLKIVENTYELELKNNKNNYVTSLGLEKCGLNEF